MNRSLSACAVILSADALFIDSPNAIGSYPNSMQNEKILVVIALLYVNWIVLSGFLVVIDMISKVLFKGLVHRSVSPSV